MTSFEEYIGMQKVVYVSYKDPKQAQNVYGISNNIFENVVGNLFFDKTGFYVIKQKIKSQEGKSDSFRTTYIPLENVSLIEIFDSEEAFNASYPKLPPLD